ncbi:MAG: glutathione S-transferase N-terminal domain-containing protein [Solirubrobacteraceae bacterium]
MATLYRCPTPTDVLCPCGRVARALERRGIAHDVVRVPLRRSGRPEIEALTGQRHVPVLVLDGEAICDSRRIVEHLEWLDAEGRSGAAEAEAGAGVSATARPPA